MFDHLLESSHLDDSNKWSNIRIGEEIKKVESIKDKLSTLSGALFQSYLSFYSFTLNSAINIQRLI